MFLDVSYCHFVPNFWLYHHNLPQGNLTKVRVFLSKILVGGDKIIANSQNVELLHSPEEGCGDNRKFGNKMATSTVEKYASGRGERNIDINRRESLFKVIIY